MSRKKAEVHISKEKAIPKVKEEKSTAKSGNPPARKVMAHSGIYFQIKLKKPVDVVGESRNEQMNKSSYSKNKYEPRKAKKDEETTLLTSIGKMDISKDPSVEPCDTKAHIDEREPSAPVISHQCQGACKCSDNVNLLHVVCSPHVATIMKPELSLNGKNAKESNSVSSPKSVRSLQTTNEVGKEEKTEDASQPVCSDLKSKNRRLSKLRPPSSYKRKSTNISESQCINVSELQSAQPTVAIPQPTISSVTQPKFVSNNGSSNVTAPEPLVESAPEPLVESAPEPLVEAVFETFSVSVSEPSNMTSSMASSATTSEPTNQSISQPSDWPAFWPPKVPTFDGIRTPESEPSIVPEPKPLSTIECQHKCKKSETLSAAKTDAASLISATRTSRIPKISRNSTTVTKVPQKNSGYPSGSKMEQNLKSTLVKTYSSSKTATAAKNIRDIIEKKQMKTTEKKIEVSQKKSFE